MAAIIDDALKQSIRTTRYNLGALEEFPESFKHGAWKPIEKERAAGHWVDGFWTGLLWLAYAHTGDSDLRSGAETWTNRLAHLKTNRGTHDLGFIFYLSHVLAGRLTDDAAWYDSAIKAAYTLTDRYNPRGEYLQAWDDDGIRKWAGRTNIDLMMNLALLYWASERTGDAALADIATQHARTSRIALVRGDGSTAHVADFDPAHRSADSTRTIPGLQPRLMLVARAGLGALWIRHLLSLYKYSGLLVDSASLGRLHRATSARRPGALLGLQQPAYS